MAEPTPPSPPQTPPPEQPGNRKSPMMPMRSMAPWYILIAAALTAAFFVTKSQIPNQAQVDYSQFMALAKDQSFVEGVKIGEGDVSAKLKDAVDLKKVLPKVENAKPGIIVWAETPAGPVGQLGVKYELEQNHVGPIQFADGRNSTRLWSFILGYGLPLLLIGGIVYMTFRSMRGGGGPGNFLGGFNRSKHKLMGKEQSRVRLTDVAGVEEAKDEVTEIITFLKDPKKFQRLGGRVPRGVLLTGSPGCGKTLLAKAVAGEADVPFFSLSGSDFVEMFVGVGASRVRDLFKQAKEAAPCIIFLDEIDAVGRKRGSGMGGGGHDERDQTLNAILVEMDGFESSDQVIVIAATNRVDVLDPALTRPGRFDRTISVPLPDAKGRLEILRVHAKKVKMSPVADLELTARGTIGFSGAELEALVNEATIMATLQNKDFVEQADLEEARDKVRWGRAKKSRKVEEEERILVAYHEAGHTVVSMMSPDADPLHKVTILARGDYGGAMFSLPKDERSMRSRRKCLASMRVSCGGRIAEARKCGDISIGASSDIQNVSAYARHMVQNWGMSDELGFVSWDLEDRGGMVPHTPYSGDTAAKIDLAVRRLVDETYRDAEVILNENWQKVEDLAQALLKHETLSAEECKQIVEGKPIGKTSVLELLEAEAKKAADAQVAPTLPQA